MKEPKVSIVIPVYNGEKYLAETIESCVKQDYKNLEIIIIDDCSSDNSKNVASSFNDSKIILKYNESNLGIAKTFNKAMEFSKGNYILFLGQDDLLPYNHISNLIKEFDPETSFIYCNSIIIDSNGIERYKTYDDDRQIRVTQKVKFYLSMKNVISSTGLIINKNKLLEVEGWDEQYKNYGEWLLWIKLLTRGKCKYSKASTVYYRKHETNITNSFSNNNIKKELKSYFSFCRKYAYKHFSHEFTTGEKVLIFMYYVCLPFKKYLLSIRNILNALKG